MKPLIRVAVTGGAGQIAYSLLFRLASGEVFGADQPISLNILEVPDAIKMLEGVKMELEDCAYPLLKEINIGSDPNVLFKEIEWALLVGAKPRGPGMERKDLLTENGKIFIEQGKALDKVAKKTVKVLVVGNPCNTNALIALKNAPSLSPRNFFAMTRLDQNRGAALLSKKSFRQVTDVKHMAIWGNHSSTQVPDYTHALLGGERVLEVIHDESWLKGEFVSLVQKRGAEIIQARGKSSAASAANAAIDTVKSLLHTEKGDWFSLGVWSEGNPYGIDQNLIYSFPCKLSAKGEWEIVQDLELSDWLKEKMALTEKELVEERKEVL